MLKGSRPITQETVLMEPDQSLPFPPLQTGLQLGEVISFYAV